MKIKFVIKQGDKIIATFKDGQRAINFNKKLHKSGFNSKIINKGQ